MGNETTPVATCTHDRCGGGRPCGGALELYECDCRTSPMTLMCSGCGDNAKCVRCGWTQYAEGFGPSGIERRRADIEDRKRREAFDRVAGDAMRSAGISDPSAVPEVVEALKFAESLALVGMPPGHVVSKEQADAVMKARNLARAALARLAGEGK